MLSISFGGGGGGINTNFTYLVFNQIETSKIVRIAEYAALERMAVADYPHDVLSAFKLP